MRKKCLLLFCFVEVIFVIILSRVGFTTRTVASTWTLRNVLFERERNSGSTTVEQYKQSVTNNTFTNTTGASHSGTASTEVVTRLNNSNTLYVTTYSTSISGRLGNRMFIYAAVLGIARAQGRQMFAMPSTYLSETFKVHYLANKSETRKWRLIWNSDCYEFDTKLMNLPNENVVVEGPLQSFKYFSDSVDEVRQEFTFQDSIANVAASILHDVIAKYRGSLIVGVHVRRGDFLQFQHLGYGVPEKSYFTKAFQLMKSKFPGRNITFLVASEDLEWCNKNLAGKDVIILGPASPAVHMAVMAGCDHMIISGGSYGWWCAWLAGGDVIYFTGFMEKSATRLMKFVPEDYYPPLWIGLSN